MKKKCIYKGGLHGAILLKLLIALLLLFVSRILLYLFNVSLFPGLGTMELFKLFVAGIRFDITSLIIFSSPFLILNSLPLSFRYKRFYQLFTNILFYITSAIAFAANLVDVIYFRFTLKRTTADIFNYLHHQDNMNVLIPQFIHDFWFIFFIWIALIVILVSLCNRIRVENRVFHINLSYFAGQAIIFLIYSFWAIIGIRGGFQLKPISIITAGNYTSAQNIPIVLNTPFTIIKTFNQKGLAEIHYFSNLGKTAKIYSPYHLPQKDSVQQFRKLNVVILILESYSREHIGALNAQKSRSFTPFLDSLIRESMSFNGFANGKRSIEGIPAVLSGLPTLMDKDYITSAFAGNKLNSIAQLLKAKGYATSFFHGGSNGTMNFNAYTASAGFDKYFGKNEYANDADYDGDWGIWDEQFLQYFAKELNKTKQPFVTALFTLSSHHPYKIPEKHKDQFPKGKLPIQQTIAYTDYSLKQFFKTASRMPWFDSTLFVITADHTSEAVLPEYETRYGNYRVPIIFYMNHSNLKGNDPEITQQIDIMPSILGYLHYDKPFYAFGSNVFNPSASHFAISYSGSSYQLVKGHYLLQFDGTKSTALYDVSRDIFLTRNLVNTSIAIRQSMEQFIKALIQQYNYRMMNNKLASD